MARIGIEQLEGGAALRAWCEDPPVFHDAPLQSLSINQGADSVLAVRILRCGPELDAEGYRVVSKRALVTFTFSDLVEAELYDFAEIAGLDGIALHADEEGVTLAWDSSYGVHGHIKAKRIAVSFEPLEEPA